MNVRTDQVGFLKGELIKDIKKNLGLLKSRLSVSELFFEEDDINNLGGITKVGYYPYIKNTKNGILKFYYWEEIDALTLSKVRDRFLRKEFYVKKMAGGKMTKVRLKR